MVFQSDLAKLTLATKGKNWSFEADAKQFKVGLEAQLIQWAHLFDPMMGQVFKKLGQDSEQEEKRLRQQLSELGKKLETLERRYAYGEIEREIYAKFSAELKAEMREIEVSVEQTSGALSNHQMLVEKGLKMMLSISSTWGKANASKKRRLQALVFPEGVAYEREKEGYRTLRVNSFFGLATEISQEIGEKKKGKAIIKITFPFQ